MDAGRQIAESEAAIDRQRKFLDELTGPRGHDLCAQHFAITPVNHFDEPVEVLVGDRSIDVL